MTIIITINIDNNNNDNGSEGNNIKKQECPSVKGQPPACLKYSTENAHQISLTLLKVDAWG